MIGHPPVDIPATPGYVLAVLRDMHRQQSRYDPEADPEADLGFDTTIAEWRLACDLLDWRRVGRGFDAEWGLSHADRAWRAVLEPAGQRTLRDLCEFLAPSLVRPALRPVAVLGSTCLPAAAFLAIRSYLRDAGADVGGLKPSTPLREYARRHAAVFLGPVSRLSPGALPPVDIRTPYYDLGLWGIAVGCVGLLGTPVLGPWGTIGGVALMAASMAWCWLAACYALPSSVSFGELRTFRELATAVAAGSTIA